MVPYTNAAAPLFTTPEPAPTAVGAGAMRSGNEVMPISRRAYTLLDNEGKRSLLMDFWHSGLSVNKFADKHMKEGGKCKRSAIQAWIKKSKLGHMVAENNRSKSGPVHTDDDATVAVSNYLNGVDVAKEAGLTERQELLSYLTHKEQENILKISALLSSMGHGASSEVMEIMVNEVVNEKFDERDAVKVSAAVLKLMRKRHPEIGKLRKGASLDPKRAAKANEDTRDVMFIKLDNWVYLLYRMGVCPWKSYADVPAYLKYNMDELGTDTTKHRNKIFLPPSL